SAHTKILDARESASPPFKLPAAAAGLAPEDVHNERLQQDYASMTHRTAVGLTLLVTDLGRRKSTRRAVAALFDRQISADQPRGTGSAASCAARAGRIESSRPAELRVTGPGSHEPIEASPGRGRPEIRTEPFRNPRASHTETQRNQEPSTSAGGSA